MPETFAADDGLMISYDVYPADRPRAIVQLAHGVGEHAGRYAPFASVLSAAGYTVYANDHRGHGRTGLAQWNGDASRLGKLGPGGIRRAIRDLVEFAHVIRERNPNLPLVFIGHSWGSLMGQIILNVHSADFDAAVLSGTAYRVLGSMNSGDLNKRFASPDATGAEWLSRDPGVVADFVADPLTTLVPLQKLFGLLDAARLLGRPARHLRHDLPILIQVGEDDPLGGAASARRLESAFRRRSGVHDVTTIVYPGARHEVYNETNRDEVVGDLIAWLNNRFPVRP